MGYAGATPAMGYRLSAHLIDGEFQSDKYPTCPRGKVPLSVKDPTAQDLLWVYAQRRRAVDAEFADDLETALRAAGYVPPGAGETTTTCGHEHHDATEEATASALIPKTCPRSKLQFTT